MKLPPDAAPLSEKLHFYWDGNYPVFENGRGPMVNGNRRIHMKNWKVEDLRLVLKFLDRYKGFIKES